MPRLRPGQLLSLGFGGLLAALAPLMVGAQSTGEAPFGLRSTFDAGSAPGAVPDRRREGRRQGRAQRPAAVQYGNPPGSGAGQTGFVSTNRPVRRGAGSRAAAVGPPLDITPRLAESASAAARPPVAPTPPAPPTPQANPATPPREARVNGALKRDQMVVIPGPDVRGPVRLRSSREDDPFDPTGIHVGSFIVKPAIELARGYNDNAGGVSNGRGSYVNVFAPEIVARSNWSRHELLIDLRGTYTTYDQESTINRPALNGKVVGRIDVTRDTRIEVEGRTLVGTDNPNSPNLQAGLARLPIFTDVGSSLGVVHRFNRFEVSLKGSADRTTYEDSKLTDGSRDSNRDRNFDQYAAALRASYELTPGMKPFIEAVVDERVHDLPVDFFGFRRNSEGTTGRIGSTFEIARTLTGEVSTGYMRRTYEDPSLRDLQGAIFDASLIWTATPLTTLKLSALSGSDESTVPGVSGVFRRDYALQVDHAFRRWLIATARLSYGTDDYEGSIRRDERYAATVALTYKLNRDVQLKGEYRREWLHSSEPGNDYTANIAMIGLRLQR
ncbi:MAG: outer membrane beta-barrel protein [Rhizobiales bacterium]|nr:outer membrane beta-barrel protein [Hyphomicrobiales bacterium]